MSDHKVHRDAAGASPAGPRPAVWDRYLTDEDKALFATAGYGGRVGWGQRVAVLVVDMTYGFCGEKPADVLDAAVQRHNACGESAWSAIAQAIDLLAAARATDLPVVYTRPAARARTWGAGRWEDKNSRTGETDDQARDIVAEVRPLEGEAILEKEGPSAFVGTPLLSWLTHLGVDTLVVFGGTTSGCVRATVVDGFSYNFRVIVPEEATFDRIEASHCVGLFDMNMKYADVLPTDEVVARLRQRTAGPELRVDDGQEAARRR